VPEVLLSGNHAAISRWRRDEALRRTAEHRPDLVAALRDLDRRDRQVLTEAGYPVTEAGYPAAEAGYPAAEAGHAAAEAGCPPAAADRPVAEAGYPVAEAGRPVTEAGP
jgi:hypothetical protein